AAGHPLGRAGPATPACADRIGLRADAGGRLLRAHAAAARLRQRELPRRGDPGRRGRRGLPGQVRRARRSPGRGPGPRGVAGHARADAAAVLALAPRQSGQCVLPGRGRRLPAAGGVEGVLVRNRGSRGGWPLRCALCAATGHVAGSGAGRKRMSTNRFRIGIVGARGHVGAELIRLLAGHPGFELAFVSSRSLDGERVADHNPAYSGELRYSSPGYDQLPELGADAVVLALPNGKAARCVEAFDRAGSDALLIDLSADYRFDPAWYYGLPELTRGRYAGQRRISNPGCYATAMQLAIAPMLGLLDGPVQCFGVSGYSGAGTTPSDRNDPGKLRDNLMPYALAAHVHEREVGSQLGHAIEFMPHVAPHF